ncbi:T9SS type A sorting domain-containing protein [Crocinitomix catalasitica]|nr:T9SS type A sorting domain-containing protein [Crocinitomix catalasitica]
MSSFIKNMVFFLCIHSWSVNAQYYLSESISLATTAEGFGGLLYDTNTDKLVFQGIVVGNTGPILYFTDDLCSPLDTNYIEKDYYGFEFKMAPNSIVKDQFDSYLICGQQSNNVDSANAVIMKFNLNGDTLWTTELGDIDKLDGFTSIVIAQDSNYVFVGQSDTYSAGIGEDDAWIVKTDTAGNLIWQNNFGGAMGDYFNDVDTTIDGGFIASGYTNSISGFDNDIMVVRVDSNGNEVWTKYFGNAVSSESSVVRTMPNGNFLVYGGWGFFEPGSSTMWQTHTMAMELDQDGNQVWFKTYSVYEEGSDAFYEYWDAVGQSVFVSDGIVFVGQSQDSLDYNPLGFIMKTDYSGNLLWMRTYRERDNDNYLRDIIEMPGGDLVATGVLFPDAGLGQDGWILRTNCLGFWYYPVADADWLNAPSNTVILDNNSIRFGDGIVYWGDGESDTFTEFDDTLISHTYAVTGAYSVQLIVNACYHADTIYTTVDATPLSISNEMGFEFRLYPNPAEDFVTIRSGMDLNGTEIAIYDLTGSLVYSKLIGWTNSVNIDLSDFCAGTYLVRLSSSQGVRTEKLIVR